MNDPVISIKAYAILSEGFEINDVSTNNCANESSESGCMSNNVGDKIFALHI